MYVKLTEVFQIPGRGTVVVAEGEDLSEVSRGSVLQVDDTEIPILLVERAHHTKTSVGLVLGRSHLPKSTSLPCGAFIEVNII